MTDVWVCYVAATPVTLTTLTRSDCGPFTGTCSITFCDNGSGTPDFNVTQVFDVSYDPGTTDYTVSSGGISLYVGPAGHSVLPSAMCDPFSGQSVGFSI